MGNGKCVFVLVVHRSLFPESFERVRVNRNIKGGYTIGRRSTNLMAERGNWCGVMEQKE